MTQNYSSRMIRFLIFILILTPLVLFSLAMNLISFLIIFSDPLIGIVSTLFFSFLSITLGASLIKVIINMATEKNKTILFHDTEIINVEEVSFSNGKGGYYCYIGRDTLGVNYLLTYNFYNYVKSNGIGMYKIGLLENAVSGKHYSSKYGAMQIIEAYSIYKL